MRPYSVTNNIHHHTGWQRAARALLCVCALLGSAHSFAEPPGLQLVRYDQGSNAAVGLAVAQDYALGINRFDLDEHTEVIGWQLGGNFYFGRQDGLDSGLTLVWQQDANQVSVSKDGLRLTRRF